MTPQLSECTPGSLEDMDNYIEVANVHHVTAKQKGKLKKYFLR